MLDRLIRMREFATDVRKAWHLGACDEDVLIVFSMRQNVVSAMVEPSNLRLCFGKYRLTFK